MSSNFIDLASLPNELRLTPKNRLITQSRGSVDDYLAQRYANAKPREGLQEVVLLDRKFALWLMERSNRLETMTVNGYNLAA